jgi:uncharacterized membrane protein YqaE (UPF0057 family)
MTDNAPHKSTSGDVILVLCALFLPPIGVLLARGLGWQFVINIILTVCGFVPGIVHAIWLIARR